MADLNPLLRDVEAWARKKGILSTTPGPAENDVVILNTPFGQGQLDIAVTVGHGLCVMSVPNFDDIPEEEALEYPILKAIAAVNYLPGLFRFGFDPTTRELRLRVAFPVKDRVSDDSLEFALASLEVGSDLYDKAIEQLGERLGESAR
jgi:hypothetical protein